MKFPLSIKTRLLIAALSLLVILAGAVFWSYKTIHLEVDGENTTIHAFAWTVEDALRTAGIALLAEDRAARVPAPWFSRQMTLKISRAAYVYLEADGKQQMLLSANRLPIDLLAQAGITLYPGDRLLADGVPVAADQLLPAYGEVRRAPLIQVQRQVAFSVTEGSTSTELLSTAQTLGAALWENGVVVHSADRLTPALDAPLTPGLNLVYQRAQPVMVATNGITLTLLTAADSVGEALAQAGLSPQGLDYTIPPEREPIPPGGLIHLVRVQEEVLVEQTPLPFETSYQAAPEVEIDNQVVLQAGEYGATAQRVRIRFEDGVEVLRSTEGEWVARPPQDRILGYGTKIVKRTLSTPDGTIEYWRALQMYAVSYHPGETGGNITASGLEVRKGLAAVDIRYIPFYTQMYVPGYGPAMAADTGGGVVGRMIDLAYPTDEYVAWHQYVTVYFLWPPPDNIVWIIP